jgi:hypothetical protein
MTTTYPWGRFGNHFIINMAVNLIAEKHNLKVIYCSHELFDKLGINLFSGEKSFNTMVNLEDHTYFDIYNCDNFCCNLYPKDYYQTREITNLLYNYLRKDEIMSSIINKNPFNYRYNKNNDLYIHIRLTDAEKFNPGINYYLKAIKTIKFDDLYISSDDPTHEIIKDICNNYPNSKIILLDEIKTMQFASTCKNIILSNGSFSAVIGYLAFFSNVNYPKIDTEKKWHGDMFSINNWIEHTVD